VAVSAVNPFARFEGQKYLCLEAFRKQPFFQSLKFHRAPHWEFIILLLCFDPTSRPIRLLSSYPCGA